MGRRMDDGGELVFDPAPFNKAQLLGKACAVCDKRWPRPSIRIGRLPEGPGVFVCRECEPEIDRTPVEESRTHACGTRIVSLPG